MVREKFMDKCIVIVLALMASLPLMVSYNIMGEELLWYLQTAEELLGFSVNSVYRLFAAGVNLATAVITYMSFCRSFQSSEIGVLASAVFTLSPYRLHLLYIRSAVGEYTALMFLPLMWLGICEILRGGRISRGRLQGVLHLAAALLGAIGSYMVEISIQNRNDATVTYETATSVDSALLLCVLLWIGLLLRADQEVLSGKQRRERLGANLALAAGVILGAVNPALMGVAGFCILLTAGVMGKYLLREERSAVSGRSVLYALAVMAFLFGMWQVNEILRNSGNINFV